VKTIVLKVGGSLLAWGGFPAALRAYLDGLAADRVVVVVGGGGAADWIRALDSLHRIGEKRSHRLALRALDLTAQLAVDLVPGLTLIERVDELAVSWAQGRTPVLAPRNFVEEVDRTSTNPLDESWDVTSDSIAARLASYLGADGLVLLKSTAPVGPTGRREAANAGLVDAAFPDVSAPCPCVSVVNLLAEPPEAVELVPDQTASRSAARTSLRNP
jgi:aspartokinase-like uncharacterized kinase